jgi:ATP-dependent Lon protease
VSGEGSPAGGQNNEQGYLDKIIDKLKDEKRQGEESSDSSVDKAIQRAQELGLTDKLAQIQRQLGENRRAEDATEQIRKLAELRDAGALTDEEFEAKKKDLLGRI